MDIQLPLFLNTPNLVKRILIFNKILKESQFLMLKEFQNILKEYLNLIISTFNINQMLLFDKFYPNLKILFQYKNKLI